MTYRALTKDKPALHCHSTERRTHLISAYSVCTLIARPHFLSNRPAEIKQRVTAYKLSNGVIRTTIINTLRAFKLLSSPVSICFRSCFKISPPVALVSRCFRSCFNLISPPVALVSILFQSVGFPHQLPLFRSCFNLSDYTHEMPSFCPAFLLMKVSAKILFFLSCALTCRFFSFLFLFLSLFCCCCRL